ncbi:MAG: HD domain-containing phosphohydrolase [Candidatus Omnitrophota bacterium]
MTDKVNDHMQRILMETVSALARAIEKRELYTVGHQQRVTQLACAIARQMELSQDRVNAVEMAGAIHDVGKLNIPIEILSKPSQLSKMEFNLITSHPKDGYDIIRHIDFPWPIAEIVLQHHEKINGSGYPRKLSGGDIILEAKILVVADVIEAMTAHRPYREALSIQEALEEIKHNQGILYDDKVVGACVRLFNEREFVFGESI